MILFRISLKSVLAGLSGHDGHHVDAVVYFRHLYLNLERLPTSVICPSVAKRLRRKM